MVFFCDDWGLNIYLSFEKLVVIIAKSTSNSWKSIRYCEPINFESTQNFLGSTWAFAWILQVDSALLISNLARYFSLFGSIRECVESTRALCLENSFSRFFYVGRSVPSSSWLELYTIENQFLFHYAGQPVLSLGRLEPCAKLKKCTKIDSLSFRVCLTLLIIPYNNVYSINKHNLNLLSSLTQFKYLWHKINDV